MRVNNDRRDFIEGYAANFFGALVNGHKAAVDREVPAFCRDVDDPVHAGSPQALANPQFE